MQRSIKLILFLVLVSTLLLSACGGAAQATEAPKLTEAPKQVAEKPNEAPTVAAPQPTEPPMPEKGSGVAPRECLGSAEKAIVDLKCREVTIAMENAYPPFNYILVKTGEPSGWDYDAWDEICTRLHCKPMYKEAAWEGMIQAVADKQFDAAADGITITEDRKEIVDFSIGYVKIEQRLLVRKGETRFKSIEEFAKDEKLVMGTQTGTTNYETAAKFLPESRIKAFEQFPFAVQALISKDIDAVILDETAGQGYMGENAENVELIGPPIESQELGFVFPKGSDLVDPVNQALKAMSADGSLDKLNVKYFGPNFKSMQDEIKQ